MMLKKIVLTVITGIFISGMTYANDIDIEKMLYDVETYKSNTASIENMHRMIIKLRSSKSFSIPGFPGRRNREVKANKINLIQKDILELSNSNEAISDKLSGQYYDVAKSLDLSDTEQLQLISFLDDLMVKRLSEYQFIENVRISLELSDKEAEILAYRRSKQAQIIKDTETLIDTLKTRKKALTGSNKDDYIAKLTNSLTILDNILIKGRKSQEMLNRIID